MSGGLLEEIVGAPDRDDLPGGVGVVSVDDGDEPDFLAAVAERELARVRLRRRDIEHGSWAEIRTAGLVGADAFDAQSGYAAHLDAWRQRWADARPIKLEGALLGRLEAFGPVLGERARMAECIAQTGAGGLLDQLVEGALAPANGGAPRLDAGWDVLTPGESAAIAEDVQAEVHRTVGVRGGEGVREWRIFRDPSVAAGPGFWLKSQALSRVESDRSGRVRFSFGVEGDDDASHDDVCLGRVGELARALLPETALLRDDAELFALLDELDDPLGEERAADRELFLTQDIAYWNAPNGGALMHHDAFEEDYEERQRAVVYAQLSGATAWVALSTQDLAARVVEFTEAIADGDMPWVKDSVFRGVQGQSLMNKILRGGRFVFAELEKPGCGKLGRIVNRGPEFTSLLADAGHAFLMRAGDVLVLPNHGLGHTAMHSVFCASETPAYSLSLALRRSGRAPVDDEPDEEATERGA